MDRQHAEFFAEHGRRRRVFCASLGYIFDNEVPSEWRQDLFGLINVTPNLDWPLVTKRAATLARQLPTDWGDGYDNCWLGVSVENRKHGLPRIDHLRAIPAKIRFLSVEPLLEDLGEIDLTGIHWVIVGESGKNARPLRMEWVENIRRQCEAAGVAFFFKQVGGPTEDHGGCLIHGREIKQFPRLLAAQPHAGTSM